MLATKGTLSSALFHSTAGNHAHGITIIEQVGKGLVPLIEAGKVNSQETKELLTRHVNPMLEAGIDYLVLGCTHYPYLIPVLRELLPAGVKIIDSGEAVARQTKAILEKSKLLNISEKQGMTYFYTNTEVDALEGFLKDVKNANHVAYLDF